MAYSIREGNLADYEKLKSIHKEVHDFHVRGRPDKYKPVDRSLEENYFRSMVEEETGRVFIMEKEGEVKGFLFLRLKESPDRSTHVKQKQLFIEDIGISQAHQGIGLGKLLFEKAVEAAKEMGADSLELGVWEFNQDAIRFYEAMGMTTQVRRMEMKIQ